MYYSGWRFCSGESVKCNTGRMMIYTYTYQYKCKFKTFKVVIDKELAGVSLRLHYFEYQFGVVYVY